MTWLPLFGTLLGAVIALGSALLVEGRRSRREEGRERLRTKREVYARYLAAHAEARTELRVLSLARDLGAEERGHRAFVAYASCYAARYELAVLAPDAVLACAQEFDREARELRELAVAAPDLPQRAEPWMREYLAALARLQVAMRADLGAGG
ncbi:hypothetical protein ACIRBX_01000 [Kitasatospora sp. NPDC096147]|uniref:hypothetical protein n=1 Tax=Kitasatospora sp. NPDC096147 TaxID=3364093 RepID=UPI00382C0496